jgi:hypothetical protein
MSYSAAEARRQLLDDVAEAADQLALSVAALTEAYEELDEQTADRLEAELFRPVQAAYGRLQRTHAEFAERHGLPTRAFAASSGGVHSGDPRVYVDRAVEAIETADQGLADLQDSMMPVEVGDRELREGLSEVRETISALPARARQLMRAQGR